MLPRVGVLIFLEGENIGGLQKTTTKKRHGQGVKGSQSQSISHHQLTPSRRKKETTGKSWKRVKVLGFLLSYLFCLSVLGEEGVGIDGSDLSISANLYIIEEN